VNKQMEYDFESKVRATPQDALSRKSLLLFFRCYCPFKNCVSMITIDSSNFLSSWMVQILCLHPFFHCLNPSGCPSG
jgi:hypothetical protein